MNSSEYFEAYDKLMRDGYSEDSPEVQALNNQRNAARGIENTGAIVISTTQDAQGPLPKPVSAMSDEDRREARWMREQLDKEQLNEGFSEARKFTDNPENWTSDD